MDITAGFNADVARVYGIVEALLLDTISFYSRGTRRNDSFCWFTTDEFYLKTAVKKAAMARAIKHLVNEGVIEVKNTYIIGTQTKCRHFRIVGKIESERYELRQSETLETVQSETLETVQSETLETVLSDCTETVQSETLETVLSVNNSNRTLTELHKTTSLSSSASELRQFHLFICELFGKNPDRIALTDKRKRKLKLRLKELGEERLKQAYIAISKSAWHRGDNPSGWSIDNKDVYWLVENAERAEEWANKAEDKKRNFNDENVSLQDLREMGLWQ